jgi:glycosyltransferase involved in cell wall biosynthesis
MKLSFYTFTMGREDYLVNLIENLHQYSNSEKVECEHHICFQGVEPGEHYSISTCLKSFIKTHVWEKNVGIAEGMNRILPELTGDVIIKIDDDCMPYTLWQRPTFKERIVEIARTIPNAVWSPYPVGLINNPGGPRGFGHETIRIQEPWDSIYTLRKVTHVGGFCRISPKFTKDWKFENDLKPGQSGNEDVQFSQKCAALNIPMYYLENGLVVEHNESTLGQHIRYGNEYFKGRF